MKQNQECELCDCIDWIHPFKNRLIDWSAVYKKHTRRVADFRC